MKSFFVALGILVGLVCVLSTKYHMGRSAHSVRTGTSVAVVQAPEKEVPPNALPPEAKSEPTTKLTNAGDGKLPTWLVVSKWETTKADAEQSALSAAQIEVIDYVRSQEPPLEWTPSLDFVRTLRKVTKEEKKDFGSGVGHMYRVTLEVKVTPQSRKEMWQHDRNLRAQQRMLWLARLLAGMVALLAAVAGYFRMEEMTKGYYTGWLRLAAAGFVGAAAVMLFLLG
jgi:hypothetical protein